MTRFVVYFIIANLIGGFFLWLVAKDLPLDAIAAYFAQADASELILASAAFVCIYAVSHIARVMRWFELVRPIEPSVDPWTVHKVCLVGLTAILLLPLRLGELVRPYLLAKQTSVKASAALGTAVVERVMDGLAMTGLLFVTLATYNGTGATTFAMTTGVISASIFSGALVMCVLAYWRMTLAQRVIDATFGRVWGRLADKLSGLLRDFITGFRALGSRGAMVKFLCATIVYWIANVLSLWVLARWGFGLEIGIWQMTTVLALLVIGIMVPGGPGMAGSFEFFMLRALALFVAVDDPTVAPKAGAFAALVHVLQLAVITIPGAVVMWIDPQSRNLIQLADEANETLDPSPEGDLREDEAHVGEGR